MGPYEAARAQLPASALAIADELIALAPPMWPELEHELQRILGPYVPPAAEQHPRAA